MVFRPTLYFSVLEIHELKIRFRLTDVHADQFRTMLARYRFDENFEQWLTEAGYNGLRII